MEYSPKVYYKKGDIVSFKGKDYVALKLNKGVSPIEDAKLWALAKEAYKPLKITQEEPKPLIKPEDKASVLFVLPEHKDRAKDASAIVLGKPKPKPRVEPVVEIPVIPPIVIEPVKEPVKVEIQLIPGPEGQQGPKGDTGDTGETGEQGPAGDIGETGPQGEIGPQGPKGDTGDEGKQGPKGDKGDTGERGPEGLPGLAGAHGPKGDKGDTGPQGPQGIPGPAGPTGRALIGGGSSNKFKLTSVGTGTSLISGVALPAAANLKSILGGTGITLSDVGGTLIITNTLDLSGLVPYTGATSPTNLGSQNLTTTGSITAPNIYSLATITYFGGL